MAVCMHSVQAKSIVFHQHPEKTRGGLKSELFYIGSLDRTPKIKQFLFTVKLYKVEKFLSSFRFKRLSKTQVPLINQRHVFIL